MCSDIVIKASISPFAGFKTITICKDGQEDIHLFGPYEESLEIQKEVVIGPNEVLIGFFGIKDQSLYISALGFIVRVKE